MGLYGFYFLFLWPLTKLCPKFEKVANPVKNFLFWGGTMRFFIESYLQITLLTLLNLKEYEWDNLVSIITLSDALAIISLVVVILLPVALIIFFACNLTKWRDEEFARRHGAFLDGADLERRDSQWIVLLLPLTDYLRRLIMSLTLVFWIDFIWG